MRFRFPRRTRWQAGQRRARTGSAGSQSPPRRAPVRNGETAVFTGTGWTCSSALRPAPVGIAGIPSTPSSPPRPSVFCNYLREDDGCPFLLLTNRFLWVGDVGSRPLRRISTGASYIKTHFGCD